VKGGMVVHHIWGSRPFEKPRYEPICATWI